MLRSQAGADSTVNDPGGGVDDPGCGNTVDLGAFGDLAISTTTSSKTSASFCLLFFDEDRNFFVVPFGQVDCGCGGKLLDVDYATGYWVFLFFVRHPAACKGRNALVC